MNGFRRMRLVSIGAAGIVLVAAPAEAAPLLPSGKWVVDFDEAQCVATREFGQGAGALSLVLKQPPLGEGLQLSIFKPRDQVGRSDDLQVELIADGNAVDRSTVFVYDTQASSRRVYRLNLSADQAQLLGTASEIKMSAEKELNVQLSNPQIGIARRVLATCVSDLRQAWNIGPDGKRSPNVSRPASAVGFDYLFTSRDLPETRIGALQYGDVSFILLVDEAGRIADCTVTKSSRFALLDAQSCAIPTKRAKFKPALGSDGKPLKDFFSYTVEWRLGMEVKRQ